MDSLNFYGDAEAYEEFAQPEAEIISYMDPELHKAASEGNWEAFNNYANPLHLLLTPTKNTILHIYISAQTTTKKAIDPLKLMQLHRRSRYQFLERILNKCSSLVTQVNTRGETPLHIAARYGQYDIVLILLAHETAQSQHEDLESRLASGEMLMRMRTISEKDTALHEAVRGNHLQVVKVLIKEDPELLNLANDAGETPLYLAVERGYRNMVSEMLKTCNSDVAYNGPNGRTALHAAVNKCDEVITRKILEKKGRLTKKKDEQGWTPLHHASYLQILPIVKQLLQSDISAAYIRDVDGRTPLLATAAHRSFFQIEKQIEVMKVLISRCPDCYEIVDHKGKNVLHLAVESFNVKGVRALLQNSLLANLINQKDDEGNTPLHQLADVGFTSTDLVRHHLLDKFAVNHRNLTAAEIIILTNDFDHWRMKLGLLRHMWKAGHWLPRRNKIQQEPTSKMRERVDSMISEYKKAKDAHLIVATLIATVTFAAGFTLPGGYNDEQGTTILTRNAAFKTFIVTDTIALVLSVSVVLTHLLLAVQGNKKKFYFYFKLAFFLTMVAMASMVLAFTAGIYAVLPRSSAFGIVTCVITACLFISCFFILYFSFSHMQIKAVDSILLYR